MPTTATGLGTRVWELPPLILHPFNERVPPEALLENSKAALMLSGLLPDDGIDPDELCRRLLCGRYSEIRMLFFLGRDVLRWIGQCTDWVERRRELSGHTLRSQSFAGLLTSDPPAAVRDKLMRWGVADHPAIFSRAVGLNALFVQPPPFDILSEEFLTRYHCYADSAFRAYMDSDPHASISAASFRFELFASGEYSRLLESQWSAE